MLIRCPTCASRYDLAADLVTGGRILRCANCRDAWVHEPHEIVDVAPEVAAEIRGPVIVTEARFFRRPAARAERRVRFGGLRAAARGGGRRSRAGIAAAALGLTLLGGGMATLAAKARVVALYGPSEALFATLGVPVNLRGLSLDQIRSTIETGDGPPTLTLEGHITNLQSHDAAVPPLRIAVRDKDRRELYYWTAPAPKATLAVGETVKFRSRLSAPPRDGQELAISFAETPAGPRRVAEARADGR